MSRETTRQIIGGVACLLLAGCASTAEGHAPPTSVTKTAAPTGTREPAQVFTVTPIPTQVSTPTPPPPAFQFHCGSNIREIAYSPDGALLAALGKQHIFICDMSTLSLRVTLETESEITGGIDWSPKGTRLVAGLATGQVRIWDTSTWQEHITFQASDPVDDRWDVAWSPDGYRLLTTSPKTNPHIWHASTGDELLSIEEDYPFAGGAWSPDSKQIAISETGASIKDAATGQDLFHIGTYYSGLWSATWSPDGTRFVVQWEIGMLTMFDAKTVEDLFSLDAPDPAESSGWLETPVWSPDGKWLASVASYYTASSVTAAPSISGILSLAKNWLPSGPSTTQ